MVKSKGVGGNGQNLIQSRAQLQQPRVQKKATATVQQTGETEHQTAIDINDRVDPRTLPKTFGGAQSPLQGLIRSGWDIMAGLYGLEGAQGGLQLQIAALGGSEAPEAAFSAESRKASTRQFVSLGFDREEAKKLVDLLAFVVAGLFTEPGTKKSYRELQIQKEVDGFRKAVTDMKKSPLPERDEKLASLGQSLLGKANQIGDRLKALIGTGNGMPKELELVENRIRAVFDIVDIVGRHLLPDPVKS